MLRLSPHLALERLANTAADLSVRSPRRYDLTSPLAAETARLDVPSPLLGRRRAQRPPLLPT